ncbi:MAG: methylated-DNA--[protein]-cysteine S-methyltransferase [Clostridia bacterium]|jgi:methylated-DNA-[protein]-cysteine S-methyltransferase|nr:methylated-DNA--[protein]-cysteine S-methyltransferase [Clostridia bacterium]
MYQCCVKCPIGFAKIEGNDDGITKIEVTDIPVDDSEYITDEMKKCRRQLTEYFNGKRKKFDLKLIFSGTEFQKKVWKTLMDIPYGKTASYKEIACAINSPNAARAVGNANHNNKHWIVVPCHRVIGSNGDLCGYGGSIWRKAKLLEFEKENLIKK